MGVDGDVTMTNLKSATGIADNRISAHHPNGAGNRTAMGDFLCAHVGRRVASSEWTQGMTTADCFNTPCDPNGLNGFDTKLGIPSTRVDGGDGSPAASGGGSLDGNGVWTQDTGTLAQGSKIWVRIGTEIAAAQGSPSGKHFPEQVLKNAQSLVTQFKNGLQPTGNKVVGQDADGFLAVDIECEITDFNSASIGWRLEDGLNTDAVNYEDPSAQTGVADTATSLVFNTTSVEDDQVFIDTLTVEWSNEGGSSPFTQCATLTALDDGGTTGDETYSINVKSSVNDPKNPYGTLYRWIYIQDDNRTSYGCPGDGTEDHKISSNCTVDEIKYTGSGSPGVRLVLTKNADGSEIIDQREFDFTPGEFTDSGEKSQSFAAKNATITCKT